MSSDKFPLGRVSTNPQITIYDVAARAGVAISSISRVLSGHPDVSPQMRLRVQKAVDDLGYEPDLLAQSLRRGATNTIGFIVRAVFADLGQHFSVPQVVELNMFCALMLAGGRMTQAQQAYEA